MLKSMIPKELRELLPLTALALVLHALLLTREIGVTLRVPLPWVNDFWSGPTRSIPFVSDNSAFSTLVVGALFAIAIGLWQTMWESGRGTFLFLLHRPATRNAIIGAKLLVGGLLSLSVGGLPILCYAIWAAYPGTHASPFFWSMTIPYWLACVGWTLFYLGAFLSGMRPARWYATRFFPLIASLILVLAALGLPGGSAIHLAAIAVVSACFVFSILHVARSRDFS